MGAASPDKAAKNVIEKKEEEKQETDEITVDGKDDENGKEDAEFNEWAKEDEEKEVKDNIV